MSFNKNIINLLGKDAEELLDYQCQLIPKGQSRLLKATQLFRAFPFNSPSFNWEDVQTNNKVVGFNCTKCHVAEYFKEKNMSSFCVNTWCKLDYPLAELWNSKLERTGSIASGAEVCDFR